MTSSERVASEYEILDAHTHFFGPAFYAALARQAGIGGSDAEAGTEVARRLGWEAPPASEEDVGRRWVIEMDRHGVRRMVSIHTLPGDLDAAARGIAAANGRLVGYVTVNPLSPGAAETVERAVREYRFRGVALFPAMFGFRIDGEEVAPILGVANRHGLNVFAHCGVLKVGFRRKLGLPTGFDLSLSNPLNLSRPCARFPGAKFIIPHLGSGMFRELLTLADTFPNVYSDTSGIAAWSRYLDGGPTQGQVLAQAIAVLGEDRLLFGTDSTFFPRGWRRDVLDEHLRVFRQVNLPPHVVGKILGGNLTGLLGP